MLNLDFFSAGGARDVAGAGADTCGLGSSWPAVRGAAEKALGEPDHFTALPLRSRRK